jgi:UDP-N-acetylmuramoyl-tripeptide--D-alanyl-D-alanine ligase
MDTPRVTFGLDDAADVRLTARAIGGTGQQIVELVLRPELLEDGLAPRLSITLNLLGASSALNAAGAVAAVLAAIDRPLSGDELRAIGGSLGRVTPVAGRLMIRDCGGIVVIDDTYNSNPRSLRVALDTAREIADGLRARLIVAIGDMLELGELSHEMHVAALRDILAARPEACVLVGPAMRRAATAHGTPSSVTLGDDSVEAAPLVRAIVRAGDVLLIKGSRGIAMERIIDALPEDLITS